MPRSSSRPSRSTESPAAKPATATRKSLRAVASPPPKAKSSPAAESRSRSKSKSAPTPAKSPSKAAKGKAATTPEPKSSPATKSRSRSTSQKPAAKKASTSKSPAPKGRSGSSKKSAGTPSAKTKSPAASRSRSKSATKKAPASPAPSPKKKSSPSPKKAKSKKSVAESPKKSAKKTPQRGRSTGRRGKKDEEEHGDEEEVDKEQDEEAKQEQSEKPETEDTTDAKADEAKDDEETKVESAAAEAEEAQKEIAKEAEMLTEDAAVTDNSKPAEAMDTVESSPSRKRKRDEEVGDGDADTTDGHDAKIIKLVDGDEAAPKSQADAPAVEGNDVAGDVAAAEADDDFILISTDEVPLADSEEMQQIAAKMTAAAAPAAAPAAAAEVCDGENGCHDDPLLSRTFISNPSISEPSGRTFSLVSYNILADFHAVRDYTGSSFITADQLAIPARHKRLMQELDFLDADVICLQEVGGDYMAELLQPTMESRGYKGVFIPRNTKAYCEGEATFYRSSQFSLVDSQGLVLGDLIDAAVDESSGLEADKKELVKAALSTYAVAMLTKLKDSVSDNIVTVANIHVAYDKFERQDRQCIQLATAVQKLIELAGGADKPHIICGDFNSWSGTAPYQLMTDGNLNDNSLVALQAIESIDAGEEQCVPVVNLWLDGFQFPIGGDLKSSYNTVAGAEPVTSRYSVDARVLPLDYIWFSSVSLEILGVLKVVDTELIKTGIPTTVFPSDHLSIKAAFAFK